MFYLVYDSTSKKNRINEYYYPSSESLNMYWIISFSIKEQNQETAFKHILSFP